VILQYTNSEHLIFNDSYPIEDGIVNALPENLNYIVKAEDKSKSFFEIHKQVMPKYEGKDLLNDKKAMAGIQMDFYDKMAIFFPTFSMFLLMSVAITSNPFCAYIIAFLQLPAPTKSSLPFLKNRWS